MGGEQKVKNLKNNVHYKKAKQLLLKHKIIRVNACHGDYHYLNIKQINKKEIYMFDLERVSPLQIASYDWFHMLKCLNEWHNPVLTDEMRNVPYSDILIEYMSLV